MPLLTAGGLIERPGFRQSMAISRADSACLSTAKREDSDLIISLPEEGEKKLHRNTAPSENIQMLIRKVVYDYPTL